jgi:multidrug efflux system outer membrane protein
MPGPSVTTFPFYRQTARLIGTPRIADLLGPISIAASLAPLLLTACAAVPNYHEPDSSVLGVPATYSLPADQSTSGDLAHWWTRFDDPQLTRLVERARRGNLDLAIALSRLRQAREASIQARAANFPVISASGGYRNSQVLSGDSAATPSSGFSLGVDASYQADLFGGRGRTIEAARDDAEASGFDYNTVIVSVQSEIARDYLLVRLDQTQLANARQALANQDDNLQIARWRNQAGLASMFDVEQARAQRSQTAATIPQLEAGRDQTVSQLAVLLGEPPGSLRAELATPAPLPVPSATVAVGVPLDMLRHRPDVRSTERQLAAATARIGVAQAQLYPALTIGGNVQTSAATLGGLFGLITGQLFGNLAQTIFDAGRLRSQVRSQRAATDGALANYRKAVLTALSDVENAIAALDAAERRQAQFVVAFQASNNSALMARQQYRSGLIDFTTLLTSENQLVSSRNGLAQAQYDRAAALVQLFTALGGGWDNQPAASAAASKPGTDAR